MPLYISYKFFFSLTINNILSESSKVKEDIVTKIGKTLDNFIVSVSNYHQDDINFSMLTFELKNILNSRLLRLFIEIKLPEVESDLFVIRDEINSFLENVYIYYYITPDDLDPDSTCLKIVFDTLYLKNYGYLEYHDSLLVNKAATNVLTLN